MVSDEENWAERFLQGLNMDIQILLIPHQLKTYSQVLIIAGEVERGLEKKNQDQEQDMSGKRTFQQMDREYPVMDRGEPVRFSNAPKAKRLFQYPLQQVIYKYCRKPGHIQRKCRMAKGLCLICEYGDHSVSNCLFKRTYPIPPTLSAWTALPALPLRGNLEPVGRRVSRSPQKYYQS